MLAERRHAEVDLELLQGLTDAGPRASRARCAADSFNSGLLRAAAELLPPGAELELFDGLQGDPAVRRGRRRRRRPASRCARCATRSRTPTRCSSPRPSTTRSIPGVLKNALDWASRPHATNPLRGKPVAVVGASTGMFGAVWAQADARKVLGAIGARVVDGELPVAEADERFDADGRLVDAEIEEQLAETVAELVAAAEARAAGARRPRPPPRTAVVVDSSSRRPSGPRELAARGRGPAGSGGSPDQSGALAEHVGDRRRVGARGAADAGAVRGAVGSAPRRRVRRLGAVGGAHPQPVSRAARRRRPARTNMPHWIPTVALASVARRACRTAARRAAAAPSRRPARSPMPSPPGRWKPFPSLRAQTRNSTPAATSSTAASTKLKTPNALRLSLDELARPARQVGFSYQGRSSERTSAAAAMPALRSSGGSSRRRARALGTAASLSFDRDVLHLGRGRLGRLEPREVPVEHGAQATSSSRSASASWRDSSGGTTPRSDSRAPASCRGRTAARARSAPGDAPAARRDVAGGRLPRAPRARASRTRRSASRVLDRAGRSASATPRTPRRAIRRRAWPTWAGSRRARPAARSCASGRRRGRRARARSSSARCRPCSANGRSSRSSAREPSSASSCVSRSWSTARGVAAGEQRVGRAGRASRRRAPPARSTARAAPAPGRSRTPSSQLLVPGRSRQAPK